MSILSNRFVDIINALLRDDTSELKELIKTIRNQELNQVMMRTVMLTDHAEHLDMLLKAGANINYQDSDGRTSLFLTVKYNRVSMINLLISNGCDVNLGKFNQSNALHLAAKKGQGEVIVMLISAGHSLDAMNWGGNTPLLIACRFGHTDSVLKLISYGANVNICNKLGHYPLHYAAFAGNAELVQILMDKSANPNVRTHLGINPVMLACERKHCSVVATLSSQCNLYNREQLYGGTVLHWAIASGCCHCVDCLLLHGASLTVADSTGRTPILEAVQSNQPHILKFLLDKHHCEDFKCDPNNRLLHLAAFLGHDECVSIICSHDNTNHLINEKDSFEESPLDIALKASHRNSTCLLIQHGAYINHFVVMKPGSSPKTVVKLHQTDSKAFTTWCGAIDPESHQSDHKSCQPNPESCQLNPESCQPNPGSCQPNPGSCQPNQESCPPNPESCQPNPESCPPNPEPCQSDPEPYQSDPESPTKVHIQQIQIEDCDRLKDKLTDLCLESARELQLKSPHKVFKTYSAVKMGMIDMLRSASSQQMVAPVKFDFNTWLDNGPEAFVLKVTSLDLTNWIHQRMHTPWALRELARGCIRKNLGYRASDKVDLLPVPETMKDFLNMKELEEIETSEIQIRSTGHFDDIDIE